MFFIYPLILPLANMRQTGNDATFLPPQVESPLGPLQMNEGSDACLWRNDKPLWYRKE